MGTLHSAHKYVNAIQGGNEALKDVHRQSSSCVPANSPPVVRIIAFTEGEKRFKNYFLVIVLSKVHYFCTKQDIR